MMLRAWGGQRDGMIEQTRRVTDYHKGDIVMVPEKMPPLPVPMTLAEAADSEALTLTSYAYRVELIRMIGLVPNVSGPDAAFRPYRLAWTQFPILVGPEWEKLDRPNNVVPEWFALFMRPVIGEKLERKR